MNHIFVILFISCYLVQNIKSDSSSSEEDNDYSYSSLEDDDESSEWLTENEDPQKDFNFKLECIDYINIEDVESCFVAQCAAECVASNLKVPEESQNVPESCSWGCKNQISTFKAAQSSYHQTEAELLLGTAVDKCWDGCIDQFDGSDQKSCISGCETMRKIQMQQLRSKVESNQIEANADVSIESKEIVNDEQLLDQAEPEQDPGHVVRAYVLWHPQDQENAYQTYNMMMSIVQKMFEKMDTMDTMDDDKQMTGGWKDDRRQLRIPQFQQRVSALTSQDEDDTDGVYNKVVDSLDSLQGKIKETIFQPEFKEFLFYVLMTICCFLLLTALYDNCTEDSTGNTEEDHYHLADTSTIVKLPSYDDCMKADRYLAVNIKDAKNVKDMEDEGALSKADLAMSLSVVLEEEEGEQKKLDSDLNTVSG